MNIEQKRILIQKITNLPTLPTVLSKIIDLTEDRNTKATHLGELLSRDQSISSLILRLVNSAYYGNLRHISSINHATVILGFEMVKTIAMGVAIYQDKSAGPSGFDREQFWIHSLAVATLSREIASKLTKDKQPQLETVFLSGLLHDVGKVIFDNYFTEDYFKASELAIKDNLWIGEAEQRVLKMDHCDAGFFLARKWQFPSPVVEVIRYHHNLDKCSKKNASLCHTVHAADYICRIMKLGSGGDNVTVELDPRVAESGITQAILDNIIKDAEQHRTTLEAFVKE